MVNNSDKTFFIQLIIWTTANGISAVSVWALLFAILRSPKVRSNSFNLYLVFCLVSDAYKNLAGFSANLANLLMDTGSPNACKVIGWNDAYWWCSSLWMSFSTFLEIHRMLMANKQTRRYKPPTPKRVTVNSVIIHVFSILMATFTVLPLGIFPKATPSSGCEAYPEPGNRAQLIFYWVFFMPLTALIPTLLVTILCFHIWWKQLIPLNNAKYRSLLFYFARLLATIYLVIIAVIVSFFFTNWVQAIAFMIFNLIGLIQVCLALFKKDVRNVFLSTWCCTNLDETSTSASQKSLAYLRGFSRRKSSNQSSVNDADQSGVEENNEGLSGKELDIEADKEARNEADKVNVPHK